MKTISVKYVLKYRLDFAPEYVWTEDNKCFNQKTGRQIKQTVCGRSIGYCIQGKFMSLNTLRKKLIKIKIDNCPF
jgi:hypothetical protein